MRSRALGLVARPPAWKGWELKEARADSFGFLGLWSLVVLCLRWSDVIRMLGSMRKTAPGDPVIEVSCEAWLFRYAKMRLACRL